MRHLLLAFVSSFLFAACASKVTSTASSSAGKYSEDLSVWRPEPKEKKDSAKVNTSARGPERARTNQYVEARYAVTDQVDTVLDSIYKENRSKGFIDGYTIQVYSGIKREDALNVKKKMSQTLPGLESDVQYRQPNFRVRSGKYLTRLEAQQDYLAVKKHFPNAIVIPDRIEMQ